VSKALVFFDESFKILIFEPAIAWLKKHKRDSGLIEFQKSLLPALRGPNFKSMQPAAKFRNWAIRVIGVARFLPDSGDDRRTHRRVYVRSKIALRALQVMLRRGPIEQIALNLQN
jgi:hypothetical protein